MKKLLNKKISVKAIIVVLLVVTCMAVTLAAAQTQISALLTPNVKITYNGVLQTPRDGNGNVVYPINYNGSVYLPVRGIAGIFGENIDWDPDSKTVLIGSGGTTTPAPTSPPGGSGTTTPPQTSGTTIPGGGGQVRVNGETKYTFTPNQSGIWSIRTSNNGYSDPMITVYDPGGSVIAEDDDSNWDVNALVFVNLNAGSVYTVEASFYGGASGSCTLTAAPAQTLPAGGGTVRVNGITAFTFTPNRSGSWTFSTSDNGDSDPHLSLLDVNGKYIDEDDDGGDGLNALLTLSLSAGVTYILDADFFDGEAGSYTLTVS